MINLVVLVVLTLAAYRATQLAVHDTVLDRAREQLTTWASRIRVNDEQVRIRARGLRGRNADRIAQDISQRLGEHPTVTSAVVNTPRRTVVITTGKHPPISDLFSIVEDVEQDHGARSPRRDALRMAIAVTLISCTYCAGWWLSGAILATYVLAAGTWHDAPLLVHGIEWAAVAGGQALLNRWDDTLGSGT